MVGLLTVFVGFARWEVAPGDGDRLLEEQGPLGRVQVTHDVGGGIEEFSPVPARLVGVDDQGQHAGAEGGAVGGRQGADEQAVLDGIGPEAGHARLVFAWCCPAVQGLPAAVTLLLVAAAEQPERPRGR